MPVEWCDSLHQTSLSHPSCISGVRAKSLLRSGCPTWSRQQLGLQLHNRVISHRQHAHTDAAVFCVINKKWKRELLAGRPLKSSVSKSSGFCCSHACLVFGFVSWEEDSLLTLSTCRSAGGASQQVDGWSLIYTICPVVCTYGGLNVKDMKSSDKVSL